ncbi:VOC family protein [Endozoicomonadaceae bacterium StTr2]
MIQFSRFSHINIVVDNMDKATAFYSKTFQAEPTVEFPHFKNRNFALSAGFMEKPDDVDVSIRYLQIPTEDNFTLELIEYHSPVGSQQIEWKQTHDLGGPRHVSLGVSNIDEAFEFVKSQPGVKMINESPDYKAHQIGPITDEQFALFDEHLDRDQATRHDIREMVKQIRYFYFLDPYGVQWEFEQKPS